MKIKRHKFKCSVPGCKNTDSIVIGRGMYFDAGCVHLCRSCAAMYAKAWKDEDKADAAKKAAEKNAKAAEEKTAAAKNAANTPTTGAADNAQSGAEE